ncbi:MOG interacting and ectopic P-granules protein 1-like [Pecten maximus]|uniref:MOG interacting and ectopic P-granules protein 1-like n=1 Tax=Pecten maximus TaxID=6579 RepID=UPI0014580E33|nr:MOG interacting and ectopic P-granules protein 1-like [Pecten maximus]
MSGEASTMDRVTVNGNIEEGPDHVGDKVEDPSDVITTIKKFKESVSQNGTSGNTAVSDAKRTDTVNESDSENIVDSKENAVQHNGLVNDMASIDGNDDKHTDSTEHEKTGNFPAEDHCVKEDVMEIDESKIDSNIKDAESPMETDSTDDKVEECKQADSTNGPETTKNIQENVQNNIDERKSEQDEEKQKNKEEMNNSDEGIVENNLAQETSNGNEESVTEQKIDASDEVKIQNPKSTNKDLTNNDTESCDSDKSEKNKLEINKEDCNSEIINDSEKKDVEQTDSSKESKENDTSKGEETKKTDSSKEDGQATTNDAKSVDTLTDEDGSEFIITINEDDSSSEKEEETVTEKGKEQPVVQPSRPPNKTQNTQQKTDTKISSSLLNSKVSKPIQQQYKPPPNVSASQLIRQANPKSAKGGPMQYYPIHHLQTSSGTSQYMQSVMVGGKSVLVPVSSSAIAGNKTQYLIDPKNSLMSKKQSPVATALNSKANTFTSPLPVAPAKQGSGQKQETYSVQKGIETIERDADLPLSSWEMIDLVKWEIASHKPDNTFWMGLCNVNKKAELSAPSKFLFDLGSDIVKESAYKQITQVQTKKKEAGKLNDVEKENLEKMKKVVKELEDKLSHMAMKQQKCSCGFQTESENVMMFHKEHPHMQPPLSPHGLMTCAHCNFETNDGTKYSFHMESEHNMVGRVYSKPAFWQCGLCYYEHNSKNKLTNHKWKCMKHFKANQNQAPHHTDINYCLKNIYYKYQIKKPPPPKPAPKSVQQHNHNTRNIKSPSIIQPRQAQGPLLANQLQQKSFPRPAIRAATQIPGVVYSNQATALSIRQNKNPPRLPLNNQNVRNPMQVVVRPPVAYKGNTTVNQLLMQAKGTIQAQKSPQPVVNKAQPKPAKQAGGPTFEVCEICGGYVKDRMSLRIHFFYAHKIDIPQHVFNRDLAPLLCEVCKARFWTTQGLSKHRLATQHSAVAPPKQSSVTVTGDNTCWICHQRQANLYTHLLQFHRLSTGECMLLKRCMFCGSLSNNRKDLEIHMAAAHGVLIKGASNPPSTAARPPPAKQPAPKTVVVGPKTSVTTTSGKGSGLVRNNFCVFCCKQFQDNTQLTLHCLGTHATCSSCGMVVAKNSDLKTHVCRSGSVRNCPLCGVKNLKPNAYTRHISTFHLKKCFVHLKRISQRQIKEATRRKEPILPVAGTVVIDLRPPEDRKRSAVEEEDNIYVPDIKRMKQNENTVGIVNMEGKKQHHQEIMESDEQAHKENKEEPMDGNNEQPKVGNATEEPKERNATEEPKEGNASEDPKEGNASEDPKEGNASEDPKEGNPSEDPKEGNPSEDPKEGNPSEDPKEGNLSEDLKEGNVGEEPKEGNVGKEPQEGSNEQPNEGNPSEELQEGSHEEPMDETTEDPKESEQISEQCKEEDSDADKETNDKSEDISQTKDDGNDDKVVTQ